MRRFAFALMLIPFAALAACDGGSYSARPDGGIIINQPDAREYECDPYFQRGCADGEKCTWVFLSETPRLGRSQCVPDGTVDVGSACLAGELFQADDCKAGSFCSRGVCTLICSTADTLSCAENDVCIQFADVFDDVPDVGLCRPKCDPVNQVTCGEGEACYLQNWNGDGVCSRVPDEAVAKVQDQQCFGPSPDDCYLNGCAKGFDTFGVAWRNNVQGTCMQFCTPAPTGLDPVNGDQLDYLLGNPNGVVCGQYHASAGEAGTECRFFNALIGAQGSNTPDGLGICMTESFRTMIELGSCTGHQLNAAADQTNIENGTYVPGCESINDILSGGMSARATELPDALVRQQEAFRKALLQEYGVDVNDL